MTSDDVWGMTVTAHGRCQLFSPMYIVSVDNTSKQVNNTLHILGTAATQQIKWRLSAAHLFCIVATRAITCKKILQIASWPNPDCQKHRIQTSVYSRHAAASMVPGSYIHASYTDSELTINKFLEKSSQ